VATRIGFKAPRRIVLRIIGLENSFRTPTTRFSCSARPNSGGDFASVSGRTERDSDNRISQGERGDESSDLTAAFVGGLEAGGSVVGRNSRIEYRWAEFKYERLQSLAVDLTGRACQQAHKRSHRPHQILNTAGAPLRRPSAGIRGLGSRPWKNIRLRISSGGAAGCGPNGCFLNGSSLTTTDSRASWVLSYALLRKDC
jgi:hypothetical protein